MSRPRAVSFHSLEVHRPVQPEPRKGSAAARPSFAELLRLRRAAQAPLPDEETAGSAAPSPVRASDQDAKDDTAAGGEGDGREQPGEGDAGAARRDDSLDWVDALTPTPAMLATMLEAPAAVGGLRRVGARDAHPLVASIAQTVARFCNEPAVDHSEGWSVRMPLRDDVLPSTTLDLTVSSCWLQLRFETSSDVARDLLFLHRAALAQLLATALNRQRDIAISIE